MKKIDYLLQGERIRQAKKFIIGDSLLDIGCHFGELFESVLRKRNISGDGIDGVLNEKIVKEKYTLFPGYFPGDFPLQKKYDNIALLAVLEHIPEDELRKYPEVLRHYLNPKGRVIITIPSKKVDSILNVLLFFKLIHGMDLVHHQDFERSLIKTIFMENGYGLVKEKRFEFGLNLLYVFEKI
ncbi:methyltransferase domain-containing protein [Flavobacterium sp.]|uniref:class I SAM-dependent methyltransferase n=1 Tax=Flavobacterium sp. TaxID=239 RepID=UPI00286CD1BE|nr:methyltransferase domain-containing protein [Flavobacterium sp.]